MKSQSGGGWVPVLPELFTDPAHQKRLPGKSIHLFIHLADQANKASWTVTRKIETLVSGSGLSRRNVERYLGVLEQGGYIRKRRGSHSLTIEILKGVPRLKGYAINGGTDTPQPAEQAEPAGDRSAKSGGGDTPIPGSSAINGGTAGANENGDLTGSYAKDGGTLKNSISKIGFSSNSLISGGGRGNDPTPPLFDLFCRAYRKVCGIPYVSPSAKRERAKMAQLWESHPKVRDWTRAIVLFVGKPDEYLDRCGKDRVVDVFHSQAARFLTRAKTSIEAGRKRRRYKKQVAAAVNPAPRVADVDPESRAVWEQVRGRIEAEMEPMEFQKYINPLDVVRVNGVSAMVSAPIPFLAKIIRENFKGRLETAFADVRGRPVNVDIVTVGD